MRIAWEQRALAWLLRGAGAVMLLALVPAFLPDSAMAQIHGGIGLGELPQITIVGYLTRSQSALYSFTGALFTFVSFDVLRYRPLIRHIARITFVFATYLFCLDIWVGLPIWWILAEGPLLWSAAAIILVLVRRLPKMCVPDFDETEELP